MGSWCKRLLDSAALPSPVMEVWSEMDDRKTSRWFNIVNMVSVHASDISYSCTQRYRLKGGRKGRWGVREERNREWGGLEGFSSIYVYERLGKAARGNVHKSNEPPTDVSGGILSW